LARILEDFGSQQIGGMRAGRGPHTQAAVLLHEADGHARFLERLLVDVGSVDQDLRRVSALIEKLKETDGERIPLFARGAASHPDPDRVRRCLLLHDLRIHIRFQRLVLIRLAKE